MDPDRDQKTKQHDDANADVPVLNDETMNGHPEDARRLAKQLLEEETAGAMRWKAASYLIAAIIGSLIWIVLHACWRALGG